MWYFLEFLLLLHVIWIQPVVMKRHLICSHQYKLEPDLLDIWKALATGNTTMDTNIYSHMNSGPYKSLQELILGAIDEGMQPLYRQQVPLMKVRLIPPYELPGSRRGYLC